MTESGWWAYTAASGEAVELAVMYEGMHVARMLMETGAPWVGLTYADAGNPAVDRDLMVRDGLRGQGRGLTQYGEVRDRVKDWHRDVLRGSERRGLYLHSRKPGSGKTYLASVVLGVHIVATRAPGTFVPVTGGFLERLKSSYDRDGEQTSAVWRELTNMPAIVLDDFDKGFRGVTETWAVEVIYTLVDTLYRRGALVILTSQHDVETLPKLFTESVTSRLRQMTKSIALPEVDLRRYVTYGSVG